MKTYDERVPHAGEDLKRVDLARLNIDRIGLNDGHRVTLDLERVVRVAGQADEAEAEVWAYLPEMLVEDFEGVIEPAALKGVVSFV